MAEKKKRGGQRKSNFYHIRWNRVGINEEAAAEVLGVTVDDVRRFDQEGAPIMAERLLLFWDRKHVGFDGWHGWLFSRGVLLFKGQRFKPECILHDRQFREKLESETYAILRKIRS